MKIKLKIILGFLTTALIPVLLLTTIFINKTTESLHDEVHVNLDKKQNTALSLYNDYIQKGKFVTKNFQHDATLKSLLIEGDKLKIYDYMRKLYFPLYKEFGIECLDITDKDGFLVADADKLTSAEVNFGEDRKHRKTVSTALATKKTVTFLEIESEGDHKTDFWINTVSLLYDDANNLIGTVNVGFSLLLVDTIKNSIGVDNIFYFGNEVLASTIVGFERSDRAKVDDPMVLDKVLGKGEIYSTQMDINGVKYEASFAPLKDDTNKVTGMLSTLEPYTRITTSINELRNMQLELLAFFVVLVVCCGYFFSNTLSAPIIKLKDIAIDISRGNLKTTIDIKSKDEIGELAAAFNQMTCNLLQSQQEIKKYSHDLEQKVAERTMELNKKLEEIEKMNSLVVNRELKMIELKKEVGELKNKLGKV